MAKPEPSAISFRQRLLGALPSMRPDVATSVWLLHLRWFAVVGQFPYPSANRLCKVRLRFDRFIAEGSGGVPIRRSLPGIFSQV